MEKYVITKTTQTPTGQYLDEGDVVTLMQLLGAYVVVEKDGYNYIIPKDNIEKKKGN